MKVKAELCPIGRIVFFLLFSICGLKSFAQTDTEFWFVVPDVTKSHGNPGGQHALLTFSTFDMESTITVSMPADPRFVPVVITIPPRTSQTINLDKYIDPVAALPNLENVYNTVTPNNSGLKITATTIITAYYQIDNPLNSEVYALKGRNALGTKFYVPFQTRRENGNYGVQPYSSINIVATEDNTLVTVTPSQDAYMHGQAITKGTSKQIVLQKGQTICVVPTLKGGIPSKLAAVRLAGTLITSDKNVAITTNDDSVSGLIGCADTIGDQILNIDALGKTYVVFKTGVVAGSEEDCYITAYENNTTITVKNNNGADVSTYTINAGQQQRVVLAGSYCIVDTDKPTSVFHVGGFGCELGGAMVPSIDQCTGSTQVAFNFLVAAKKTFNVNIMVRTAGKDEFYLNGTKVNVETIAGATWKQLPGTDWWFIQIIDWNQKKSPELIANTSNIFSNKGDLFHFGVFYGGSDNSCNYGYFSDFNRLNLQANVGGVEAGQARVCFGTPIQLYATGGTTYKWAPAEYLNDGAIYNPIANIPVSGARKYTVEISGACGMTATREIDIEVFEPVEADFSVDNISGCSPLSVNFKNTSLNAAELRWIFGDGTEASSSKFVAPGLIEELNHVFTNNSDTARTFTVQLLVKNSAGCGKIMEKKITVYPSVEAKLLRIDPTPTFCSPRSLTFQNVSPPTALPASDITYIWDFGDGGSINTGDASVSHSFSAFNKAKQQYNVSLTMINKFGCKSVATDTVNVYGLVDAYFTLDKNSGCPNPDFKAVLTDGSTGLITKKTWTWDGFSNVASATLPNAFDISTANRTPDATAEDVRTVMLEVEGAGGCKDVHQQTVTIHPYVNAMFSFVGDGKLCDGDLLNIKNSSSLGSTEYYWELGDGSATTDRDVSHLYQNSTYAPVDYEVKLTAKSASGCQSTYVSPNKVTVYSRINTSFVVKDFGSCAPFNATILNGSKGNATNVYEWDFGDGSAKVIETGVVDSRTHLFANTETLPKDYFVDLKVTNEGGCFSTTSRQVRVYPQPVADFSVDNALGCNPLPVAFTASTNEANYDYSWSFDDGAAGDQANVSHTYNNFDYTADKVFNPLLTVSSIYGCSATKTKPITVHPLLKAAFTVQQPSTCSPFDVQVTPRSLGATSYIWNYGDGRTETKTTGDPFSVTYTNAGAVSNTYNISLVATNSGGACQASASVVPIVADPPVVANGSFVIEDKCTGVVSFTNTSSGGTSYVWDFGDGQSVSSASSATVQKHTFENWSGAQRTYVVTLTAENSKGCKSTKTFNVDIVPRVEASFTYDVLEKCTPMKIHVVNFSLNGTEFQWDYGHTIGGITQKEVRTDATPFDKVIDSENSSQVQTYILKLTTLDKASGCSSVATKDLTIYPKVLPSFNSSVVDKCAGQLSFLNTTTGATSYTWDFGDQSSSFTTNTLDPVSHTFMNRNAADASFNVKLLASNAIGCSAEKVQSITVVPRVESSFALEVQDKCTPVKINLTNTSLNGTEFQWDYGHTIGGVAQQDVKAAKDAFVKIIDSENLSQVQTYLLKLTTLDKASGCSAVSTKELTVYPRVLPSFNSTVVDKCTGQMSFKNTSTGAISYTWGFGDQNSTYSTGNLDPVLHTYVNRNAADAIFGTKLIASNAIGCFAEVVQNIPIVPRVESSFTLDMLEKCTPIKVNFTNTSLNGTEYQWDYGHMIGGVAQLDVKTTKEAFTKIIDSENLSQIQTYVLKLTTLDKASGCSSVSTKELTVYPKVLPSFNSTVDDKCNGQLSFLNTTTGANSYTWDFGDQSSSFTTNTLDPVSHTFLNRNVANATYNVKLKASNALGCSAEKAQTISVVPRVESNFTLEVQDKCTPVKINLTNTSLNGTEFQWNYGHTIGGIAQQEVKTTKDAFVKTIDSENLSQVQTYVLKLTTLDKASGCSAISTKELTVYPKVLPSFNSTVVDKCTGQMSFKNTSTGAISYTWNFGDQSSMYSTSNLDPVSHTYVNRNAVEVVFGAKLLASNIIGCSAEVVQNISIVPRVESSFTLDVLEKCTPVKVKLTNVSLNGTEFQWNYGHTIGGVAQAEVRTTKDAFERIIDNENISQLQTYALKLTAVDKVTGCSAVSSKDLTVYPKVLPSFTYSVEDKCKGKVSFQNTTTGASTYTWFFGDPSSAYTTDKLDAVSHTYLNRNAANTTFNAKLVAGNAIGCTTESTKDISIVPRVESSFTLEELEVCTPMKVKLTNTSLNGHQFTWDYGHTIGGLQQVDVKTDKQIFEKIIDSELPNTVQTYPIKLTVLDKNTSCADDSTINLTVHPQLLPSFTADKQTGCSNLPVTFTNTSTGGILTYSWDFNDGQSLKTSDISEAVAHTFVNRNSTSKSYSVVLTATNAKGCKATASKPIGVYPKVEAAFAFVQPSKCTPFPIDITNSSLNGTEYSWDFGHTVNGSKRDTLTTSKTGFRTYIFNGNSSNAQTYTLTLTARDAVTGCSDMVTKNIDAQPEVRAAFNLSTDKGCTPLSVSFANTSTGSSNYSWNFGNGTSSASAAPAPMAFANSDTVSVKSFNITLTAKNTDGCSNVSTKRVDVYPKVMADFNLDRLNGCTPLSVKVVNAFPSSAYRYEWTLGSNGTSTAQQIPNLNFINSTTDYSIQNETLKLKVFYKGDASCFKEVERSVAVYPGTRSDFAMDVAEACNPLVVNFTNSTKSYNNSATYRWNFDNLGSSGEVNPKYTFTNLSRTDLATYAVKLRSTSIHGCADSTTKTVVVRPIPKALMAINTASGCAPFNVEVQNLSVGSMPSYTFWLDGNKSASVVRNGNSPVQFSIDNLAEKPKTTEVWLRAVSDFGCKDSTSQKVYTFPHVTSAFTFDPTDSGCNPLRVGFTNTSKNAIYYDWDFDDGVTAHIDSPSHIFQNFQEQDKVFNVKLKAKSEYGCEHVSSKEFTVYSAPIAYFTIDPPLRTYPDASFLFNNLTSPKATSWNYEWSFGDGGKYVGIDPPVYTYKTWGDQNNDYKYFVTLKVSNGNCKDEMTQFLYLKPAIPISIFASSVGSSCSPLETQFSHQAKFYKSIEWTFGDGTTSTDESPFHVYNTPGKYHVQLAVKGDGGTSYSYKTLEVFPNPVASFKLAPAEAMLPEARVQFYNTSTEGKDYAWDFGDVLGSSTEKNPTYSYKKLGSYDVRLKVTSENGCEDETLVKAAVKVVGEGLLKFPNAFIPNPYGGNGGVYELPDYKNEVFHPTSEGVVSYKLLIYNRWGEKLFESDDISKGWDGYYKGKLCEQGVYVYRSMGRFTNGKTFDVRGDVTLLR